MICRNISTKEDFNYKFIEEGKVQLTNPTKEYIILYEDWCMDYLIIDKWRNL